MQHGVPCILSVPFIFVDIKWDLCLNAVLFSASPIPIVRVPSQDVIDAEELGDATDGVANGPEDRLDNVLNQVADSFFHGPDEPQDGKVLIVVVSTEAEIWTRRIWRDEDHERDSLELLPTYVPGFWDNEGQGNVIGLKGQ